VAYSESETVTATLVLRGIWLHDPLDEAGSIDQFLLGGATSSASVDVVGEGSFYAGRTHQVVDYGPYETETVAATVTVPFGETWANDLASLRAFAGMRRSLRFRDGRGRNMLATMGGYQERDQRWGTQAGFTMARVDGG
jgi:hypothetical protein